MGMTIPPGETMRLKQDNHTALRMGPGAPQEPSDHFCCKADDMLVGLVWQIPQTPNNFCILWEKKKKEHIEVLGPLFFDSLLFCFGTQRPRIQLLTIVSSAHSHYQSHMGPLVFSFALLLSLPSYFMNSLPSLGPLLTGKPS